MEPTWFGINDLLDFLIDIFDEPPGDVGQKFELWALTWKHMYSPFITNVNIADK
jgi:hypothetical protein